MYHPVEFYAKRERPSAEHTPSRLTTFPQQRRKLIQHDSALFATQRKLIRKKVKRETKFCCPDCDVEPYAVPRFQTYRKRSNFD
ncbi:hypothetical protein TNCV_670911 [Trichonephila clavipes]|nr:hypothetical protein TNCV_670911 [Trichonephila clavipes]